MNSLQWHSTATSNRNVCCVCKRLALQPVYTAYSDGPWLKDQKTGMPFPAKKEVLFPTVPIPATGITHPSFKRIPGLLLLGLRLSERESKRSLPSIRLENGVVPPVPLTYTSFVSQSLIKHTDVPCCSWLIARFWLLNPGFDSTPVHVGFVWMKWNWERFCFA